MLCQWYDGEFVPEVVDKAVAYLLSCACLQDSIVIPATTFPGFPQERMPPLLLKHAIWIVHEGEDFFLVETDMDKIQLTIWSTQPHPPVIHWICCNVEAMMPVDAHIYNGWHHLSERRFLTMGLASAMAVLMATLYWHLQRVPEVP